MEYLCNFIHNFIPPFWCVHTYTTHVHPQTPLGSAPASIPAVMPVSVPVSSTNTVHRQIHQHLKGQLETQKSSGSSAGPLSSASSGSLFSPQRYVLP